jgi:hypothetical protein
MAGITIRNFTELFKPAVMKNGDIQIQKKSWRRYSDADYVESDQKFSIGMPFDNMAPYSRWTVRGLSNDEIYNWIKEVKMNAPEFMFLGLMAVAEKELQPNRWNIIRNILSREFRFF